MKGKKKKEEEKEFVHVIFNNHSLMTTYPISGWCIMVRYLNNLNMISVSKLPSCLDLLRTFAKKLYVY